ncbi:MAG: 4-alpha-glucanotransferase, partial [Clostridia bacterium]
MNRSSGILMHISSLPSNYGIGTLGHEAYRFVDFLKRSKLKYWQVLPINPTSYGDSPYAAFSAFAGNPYFIDLDILCGEKLIYENEYINMDFGQNSLRVDYGKQFNTKIDILKIAYNRDKAERNLFNNKDYINFKTSEDNWLKDYALFMATKYFFNLKSWQTWPEDIKRRDCGAIAYYTNKLEDSIEFFKYVQFKFFEQWYRLKSYANRNGIKIIGDVPIYVAVDSADAWANSQLFELDENKNLIEVAGCPPDNFSADGQLWGNPVYNWDNNAKEDFRWWISRIKLA